MKKIIILYVFVLWTSTVCFAQTDAELTKSVLVNADAMGKKFLAKDYAGFLKYTHPATVSAMGGEQKMLADTKKEIEEMEKDGIIFRSVKFGVPSEIVKEGNEIQCTLPESIEVKVKGGVMTTTTTMIALSKDNGKNWYFIDTAGNNLQNMKLLIPTLSDKLYVPMPTDPIFEEDPKESIKTE